MLDKTNKVKKEHDLKLVQSAIFSRPIKEGTFPVLIYTQKKTTT